MPLISWIVNELMCIFFTLVGNRARLVYVGGDWIQTKYTSLEM